MSSKTVRDAVLDFLTNETSEKVIDLTADFQELRDMLTANGVGDDEPWLGVQFVGAFETVVDVGATNTRGKYRENGIIYLHVVDVAKLGVHNLILNRAEVLRSKFRGMRIGGTVIIESVSPPNFGSGVTLSFEGGYTAALIQVDYQKDIDL